MDYIHYNAVKHGYVASPMLWQYSTLRREVNKGRYDLYWADAQSHGLAFGERSMIK